MDISSFLNDFADGCSNFFGLVGFIPVELRVVAGLILAFIVTNAILHAVT